MGDPVNNPVTLITGTRKGIGRHLAEHYLGLGHRVIGCSRQPADLDHANYRHVTTDVCDEAGVKALFAQLRKQHGRLDNLVNNAGIASMNHSLLTPVETVRRVMDTNLTGAFLFAREAAKVMQKAKYGRIVNFTTVAVALNLEGEAAYVASKAAVEALTRVMARELSEFGITVNAVGPVPIETDLIRAVPRDKIDNLVKRQAIKRLGTFEDVANVVDFFIRPESRFITGQVLYLGGV
jgi:3-oxoacyl-[acyl-carrier protein] reductase